MSIHLESPKDIREPQGAKAPVYPDAGPAIGQLEFEESDFPVAEKIAKALGYTQTAYTSSSALWGLFCLPDNARQKSGCIIKTPQFGFLFVQHLEDMHLEHLA